MMRRSMSLLVPIVLLAVLPSLSLADGNATGEKNSNDLTRTSPSYCCSYRLRSREA